jgi:sortase A
VLGGALAALVVVVGCSSPVQISITWETPPPSGTTTAETPPPSPTVTRPTPTPRVLARMSSPAGNSPLFFRLRTAPPEALEIPRLGLAVPVQPAIPAIEGDRWHWVVPNDAAAHLLGSANPGEPGNIVITGHVDTHAGPGVFARLAEIQVGDRLVVRTAVGEYRYLVVESLVVPEDDVTVLRQTGSELLTLITCVPDGAYAHRLVVRARPAT